MTAVLHPAAIVVTPSRSWARRHATSTTTVVTTPQPVELTWGNRRPGSSGFERWATYLGHEIDEHGLVAVTPAIESLVQLATELGVTPVAVSVLADTSAPEPARLRAFARVVQAILRPQ